MRLKLNKEEAKLLHKARLDKGLSRYKAAALVGCSPQSLANYECGYDTLEQSLLEKMSEIYEVDLKIGCEFKKSYRPHALSKENNICPKDKEEKNAYFQSQKANQKYVRNILQQLAY